MKYLKYYLLDDIVNPLISTFHSTLCFSSIFPHPLLLLRPIWWNAGLYSPCRQYLWASLQILYFLPPNPLKSFLFTVYQEYLLFIYMLVTCHIYVISRKIISLSQIMSLPSLLVLKYNDKGFPSVNSWWHISYNLVI